jgi:two-component system response regulator HydG
MSKILCIDDDMDISILIKRLLEKNGYKAETAINGKKGLELLEKGKHDLVLCDFRLPDKDGLEMIQEIKKLNPQASIITITGYSDVKTAVQAIKFGAYEYVTKPIHPDELLLTIKKALATENKTVKTPQPVKKTAPKPSNRRFEYVQGSSSASAQVYKLIKLVAPTNMSVVVLGETGTGKEFAAKAIHENSDRSEQAFVAVDCGALPKDLAGSELFGHVKGAFTGALKDKQGHFERANGGTLFLDEIGNLSYENQIKLLRVLQERKVQRIGGDKEIDVDIRIIVATNERLQNAVRKGEFREDLYYRINEFKIQLPALRERKSDISIFAEHFLNLANDNLNKEVEGFDKEVMDKISEYYWPGNLRELKNVIQRAVLLTPEKSIALDALPDEIIHPQFFDIKEEDESEEITDLKSVVEKAETKAIGAILKKTAYNKSKAAEILKVDRKTLYNKINAYGLDV